MRKLKKHVLLLSAFVALCGAGVAGGALVNASATETKDYTFELFEGASVRLTDPTGIRFRVKLGADLKQEIDTAGDKVGMIIVPYDYVTSLAANADYYTALTSKIDLDLTENLYQSGGYWYGNGVIKEIQDGNLDRDFVGIGYRYSVSEQKYTYTPFNETDNVRNAVEVAELAYKDYEAETEANVTARKALSKFLTKKYATLDSTFGGLGTEAYPYTIYTTTQFNYLSQQVLSGKTYEGVYFKLQDNLTDVKQRVGSPSYVFAGNFDGNGKKITANIAISSSAATADKPYVGLFAFNYGVIENLTVDGTITGTNNSSIGYIGGIAGSNAGIIRNCVNYATVSGYFLVGGIAGINEKISANTLCTKPTIDGCKNYGTVSTTVTKAATLALASKATATSAIGGIVGKCGQNCTVTNSENHGNVTGGGGTKNNSLAYIGIGGIVGSNCGTVSTCTNTATVSAYYNVGQIEGYKSTNAKSSGHTESGSAVTLS